MWSLKFQKWNNDNQVQDQQYIDCDNVLELRRSKKQEKLETMARFSCLSC